jgi:hypothetical protein
MEKSTEQKEHGREDAQEVIAQRTSSVHTEDSLSFREIFVSLKMQLS